MRAKLPLTEGAIDRADVNIYYEVYDEGDLVMDEAAYGRIRCPMLVIHGDKDSAAPLAGSEMVAKMTDRELAVIPGAAPSPHPGAAGIGTDPGPLARRARRPTGRGLSEPGGTAFRRHLPPALPAGAAALQCSGAAPGIESRRPRRVPPLRRGPGSGAGGVMKDEKLRRPA